MQRIKGWRRGERQRHMDREDQAAGKGRRKGEQRQIFEDSEKDRRKLRR